VLNALDPKNEKTCVRNRGVGQLFYRERSHSPSKPTHLQAGFPSLWTDHGSQHRQVARYVPLLTYPLRHRRSRKMSIDSCSSRRDPPLRLPLLHHLHDLLPRRELFRLGRVLDKIKLAFGRGGMASWVRRAGIACQSGGVRSPRVVVVWEEKNVSSPSNNILTHLCRSTHAGLGTALEVTGMKMGTRPQNEKTEMRKSAAAPQCAR